MMLVVAVKKHQQPETRKQRPAPSTLVTGSKSQGERFWSRAHLVEVESRPAVDVVGDQHQALPLEQLLAARIVPLHQLLDGVDLQPQCLLLRWAWGLLQGTEAEVSPSRRHAQDSEMEA